MLEGALSRPIETKCLMYVNASDLWSLQISLLVSIGRIYPRGGGLAKESIVEGRAINLASLNKNLLLRGHCSGRIFEDLHCNSVLLGSTLYLQ